MEETKYFACWRPPLNHCNGNIIRMNGIWLPNLHYNREKSCMLLLKSVRLWSIECEMKAVRPTDSGATLATSPPTV
jgi:hypothetical protein